MMIPISWNRFPHKCCNLRFSFRQQNEPKPAAMKLPIVLAASSLLALLTSCPSHSSHQTALRQVESRQMTQPPLNSETNCSYWADQSAGAPLRVTIDLSEQTAFFYRGDTKVGQSRVATGRSGYSTPTGSFTIMVKGRRETLQPLRTYLRRERKRCEQRRRYTPPLGPQGWEVRGGVHALLDATHFLWSRDARRTNFESQEPGFPWLHSHAPRNGTSALPERTDRHQGYDRAIRPSGLPLSRRRRAPSPSIWARAIAPRQLRYQSKQIRMLGVNAGGVGLRDSACRRGRA
jgi:lipoprotein-anchoring transpeptidase ErfK/SrfK